MNAPLTYTVPEAAERLGGAFTVTWLREHINEIPHVRAGNGTGKAGRIGFTEAHLLAIVESKTVNPVTATAPARPLTRRKSA